MPEEIQIGNSFLIPTPPGQHLFIIIAPIPEKSKEQWLMVNLTTSHKIDFDKDCIIDPATDLPSFIRVCSTIDYREAVHYMKNEIIEGVRRGGWRQECTIPQKYIYKIQKVGASSKKLKGRYRDILKNIVEEIEEREKRLKA